MSFTLRQLKKSDDALYKIFDIIKHNVCDSKPIETNSAADIEDIIRSVLPIHISNESWAKYIERKLILDIEIIDKHYLPTYDDEAYELELFYTEENNIIYKKFSNEQIENSDIKEIINTGITINATQSIFIDSKRRLFIADYEKQLDDPNKIFINRDGMMCD